MGELVNPVSNGKVVEQTSKASKSSNFENTLGKDAFLKLLVTQMKYQDPLNPSTDTEYIAQLATFSQLEQLQNISQISTNSQAFGLVGKTVIIKTQSQAGNTSYVSGRVDFISMINGKAQMSVNGKLYSVDQLESVLDETYLAELDLPKVEKAQLKYDADDPKDLTFKVFMGDGKSKATELSMIIGDTLIDSSKLTLKGDTVIVDRSVFEKAANGKYDITIVFNDRYLTVVSDALTLEIVNSEVEPEEAEWPEAPMEEEQPGQDEEQPEQTEDN